MDQCSLSSIPADIVSPGQLARNLMDKAAVSREQAALRLGLSLADFDRFCTGELALTRELAAKLEEVTGSPASFWLEAETTYRRRLDEWHHERLMAAIRSIRLPS